VSDTDGLSPTALIEALIFSSPQPVSVEDLASAIGLATEEVETSIAELQEQLTERGLRLQRNRSRLQLVSAPEAAPYVEELLGLDVTLRLTQASMETLAIVAYAQPVTRPQIESIRGVNSDSTIRTLLSAGLIEEKGRADTLGRPILYGTTFEFLQQFGLERPTDLPPLQDGDTEHADGPEEIDLESKPGGNGASP
jgi:segregation and condensation protein B